MMRISREIPATTETRPRVLILSASCGSGHGRAAEAVRAALEQICPDAVVAHVDVLDFAFRGFRRIYADGYFDLVHRAPHLVGYLYDRLDRVAAPSRAAAMRMSLQRLNLHRLVSLLTGGNWDLVINTHFLPAGLVASLRLLGRIDFPHATVITDFHPHGWWIHQPCERYFTATAEAQAALGMHIPADRISATGIPIHPEFAATKNVTECRRRLGIDDGRAVILQMSGGHGFGPVEAVHRAILETRRPIHLVTVAGRNDSARRRLEQLSCPVRHQRTILGYTTAMDALMAAADVIVSKPGGLTTSEALAIGLPMVVIDPIPGQESHNAEFLLENGAAVKTTSPAMLPYKLDRLLSDEGRIAELSGKALRLGRPRAAFDVAREALELIGTRLRPRSTTEFRGDAFRVVHTPAPRPTAGIL